MHCTSLPADIACPWRTIKLFLLCKLLLQPLPNNGTYGAALLSSRPLALIGPLCAVAGPSDARVATSGEADVTADLTHACSAVNPCVQRAVNTCVQPLLVTGLIWRAVPCADVVDGNHVGHHPRSRRRLLERVDNVRGCPPVAPASSIMSH